MYFDENIKIWRKELPCLSPCKPITWNNLYWWRVMAFVKMVR